MFWTKRSLLTAMAWSDRLTAKESVAVYQLLSQRVSLEECFPMGRVIDLLPTKFLTWLEDKNVTDLYKEYMDQSIHIITIDDVNYPDRLREIFEPPIVLFAKGNLRLLKTTCLGVVGGRRHSAYGQEVLKNLLPDLCQSRITIVSGLAMGIDSSAHRLTLEENGNTIAVIGCGIDRAYPRENVFLQEHVAKRGLLISEYPLGSKPLRYHFPYRNRIIAGLSHGVLVVEAEKRSGSLITANLALQENRHVFAVPGSIFNPFSMGTNELIAAGAYAVTGSTGLIDCLDYYN